MVLHHVRVYYEAELVTEVEAPPDATNAELQELALRRADSGLASFETMAGWTQSHVFVSSSRDCGSYDTYADDNSGPSRHW